MDTELLIALAVLWISTTIAMISFLHMWFSNNGELFHPHSIDVEHRHSSFLVVNSKTFCKIDCPVQSISSFIAPRGSSSSKQFTVLIVIIATAGFLGTSRWYAVGDAEILEAILSFVGFGSLLLVTSFELDVVPERFLEEKLIVTGWLIEKLKYKSSSLPFHLSPHDPFFLDFIRSSPLIYHLYEEDKYILNRGKRHHARLFIYNSLWHILHMMGACSYIICLTSAILVNDFHEVAAGWITGVLFFIFAFLGYLTGNYSIPVLQFFRGWVLLWNPFYREPHYMYKLKKVIMFFSFQSLLSLSFLLFSFSFFLVT
jgi:hypothetical protein